MIHFQSVLKKGYYRNFVSTTVQHAAIVFAFISMVSFPVKEGQLYSRLSLVICMLYIFITYAVRELRKREMQWRMERSKQSFCVTTKTLQDRL